jgi:hypothetical protein
MALVVLAATGVLVVRRRRAAGGAGEELVSSVPAGVRVFDMEPDDPREITDSLLEPRSARDARMREALEQEALEHPRPEDGD